MTSDSKQMSRSTKGFPYPPEPEDGDVIYHKDIVCQYYASAKTWACTRITNEIAASTPT